MAKTKNGEIDKEDTAPVPQKLSRKKGATSEKNPKAVMRNSALTGQALSPYVSDDPPSRTDIVTQARLYGPASIETLAEVMQCGTEASRVAAAKSLLDRGFGKVDQNWPSDGLDAENPQCMELAGKSVESALDVPSVPVLDGLAPEDLARISSIVWGETHKQ